MIKHFIQLSRWYYKVELDIIKSIDSCASFKTVCTVNACYYLNLKDDVKKF